jgi:hypothetical protein
MKNFKNASFQISIKVALSDAQTLRHWPYKASLVPSQKATMRKWN